MLIWSWTTTPYSTNAFWSTIDLYIHHAVLALGTIDIGWLSLIVFHFAGCWEKCHSLIEVCYYHTEQPMTYVYVIKMYFSTAFGGSVDYLFFIRKVLLIYREVPLHCIRIKKLEMKFHIQGMLSYSVLLKMARRNSPTTEEVI